MLRGFGFNNAACFTSVYPLLKHFLVSRHSLKIFSAQFYFLRENEVTTDTPRYTNN